MCFIDTLQEIDCSISVTGYVRQGDPLEVIFPGIIPIDERPIETDKAGERKLVWLLISLIKNLPYSAAKYFNHQYLKWVQLQVSKIEPDVVIIDHAQLGWLKTALDPKQPLVLLAHNVERKIYEGNQQQARNCLARLVFRREAELMERLETSTALRADQVWTLTEADAKYFAALPGVKQVVTFPITPTLTLPEHPLSKQFDIGLIGSWSWQANADALTWFLESIYPLLPDTVSIHVAGADAAPYLKDYPQIHYRGFVPDAQAFMAQARVVAIPTVHGSGIQIKTLDAIASGSKIVATPVALRGIDPAPPSVRLAETATSFAATLLESINDSEPVDLEQIRYWYYTRQHQFREILQQSLNSLTGADR